MHKHFIVAIDGTAASGKSTTARGAARVLGWFYLDTGAMYRAITYKIIRDKIDFKDINALREMLVNTFIEFRGDILKNGYNIHLDGMDVTKLIRAPEIDAMVSQVSTIPEVREKMVKEQRKVAEGKNTICEGRDIASVVFPQADLKFYLDCSLNERVTRRVLQVGTAKSYKTNQVAPENPIRASENPMQDDGCPIRDNLISRDYIDSNREVSPLVRVPDAIYLDTTNIAIEEEIQFVVDMIKMEISKIKN